jgi:hypothetical protein
LAYDRVALEEEKAAVAGLLGLLKLLAQCATAASNEMKLIIFHLHLARATAL